MKNLHSTYMFILTVLLFFGQHTLCEGQSLSQSSEKLTQVMQNISNYYVDNVEPGQLADDAIRKMLDQLDPHSEYFTKSEADELMRNLEGSFEGIGITYSLLNDTIFIISVVEDGPSQKVGMTAGDRIIKIENTKVAGVSVTDKDIRKLLLGKKGSKVQISVKRKNSKKLLSFNVVRDKINLSSISASYMLNNNTGYIKLERFSQNSHTEFRDSLSSLRQQGAKHLVFDLRGNTGGYLSSCLKIANEFWDNRQLIVVTQGKNSEKRTYETTGSGNFADGKLAVLINENSASASEIIAGAIQDLDRGIIVGHRSFGKGLVQRPFFLNDGSMMRLTVARYYTPSGRCIQKPYNGDKDAYNTETIRRNTSTDAVADSGKIYYTQNGREVYGGGAIKPDIWVDGDEEKYSMFYRKLLATGLVFDKVHIYADNNRSALLGLYKTAENYCKYYELNNAFVENLTTAAPDSLILNLPDTLEAQLNKKDKAHLKALIVNDLWGQSYFYKNLNSNSEYIRKALEGLKDDQYNAILRTDEAKIETTQAWRK